MGNELKDMALGMERKDKEQLKSTIDDLSSALEVDNKKARLPENIFKHSFLPSLNGDIPENDVALAKYVEYAGGPYKEVDIVNNRGEIVYTCPPLYNRSSGKEGSKIPYNELAGTYELKKARLPSEADNYMNNIAVGISNEISVEKTSNEYRWGKIFDRYTVNEDIPIVDGNKPSNVQNDKIDDDFIDYD